MSSKPLRSRFEPCSDLVNQYSRDPSSGLWRRPFAGTATRFGFERVRPRFLSEPLQRRDIDA
jgi:hypothetical protein